ncbi:hypothetical protein GWO43_30320 [candidate division KSB1 bacterium]|nr:hypothetical protein [candidate division KSB1 bacterium]NIV70654.1 hypothetical protein [Phycisphaerae bacterium]NIS28185.1 hypothetical protein [candidate division KSB1 bacterium]NIT75078.1 hypothetical protein [candidate division KSB1 bacterium]NIU28864.1 hypothetical protein [candidate division KSB1 bacterium]
MAYRYWDYDKYIHDTTTSGTSTDASWYASATSCTADTYSNSAPLTSDFYRVVRRILVTVPEIWKDLERALFTKLVNKETNTGWRIEMWISGDIDIVDPNVEVRALKEFIPLLKERATPEDCAIIDKFFEEIPIEDPPKKKGKK